jgi:hypothetical protein
MSDGQPEARGSDMTVEVPEGGPTEYLSKDELLKVKD